MLNLGLNLVSFLFFRLKLDSAGSAPAVEPGLRVTLRLPGDDLHIPLIAQSRLLGRRCGFPASSALFSSTTALSSKTDVETVFRRSLLTVRTIRLCSRYPFDTTGRHRIFSRNNDLIADLARNHCPLFPSTRMHNTSFSTAVIRYI